MQKTMAKLLKKIEGLFKEHDNEPEVLKQQTVVLQFHMHCKGCARHVKKFISKWKGVSSVNIDEENELATVHGKFDEQKLVKGPWTGARKRVKVIKAVKSSDQKNGLQIPEKEGKSSSSKGLRM